MQHIVHSPVSGKPNIFAVVDTKVQPGLIPIIIENGGNRIEISGMLIVRIGMIRYVKNVSWLMEINALVVVNLSQYFLL